MISKIFSTVAIFFLVSCNTNTGDKTGSMLKRKVVNERHTVAILPFNDADSIFIKELNGSLQKQLTNKDISTRKGSIGNCGVLGLGFVPEQPVLFLVSGPEKIK